MKGRFDEFPVSRMLVRVESSADSDRRAKRDLRRIQLMETTELVRSGTLT